jgi:hypothetical protein
MIGVRSSCAIVGLMIVAASALAGPPPIVHSGEVLDASSHMPIGGVLVSAFYDEWPANASKPGVYETRTDSLGVYYLSINRPARVVFFKAGYDSVSLHWPEEFEGSDQGGCGISLGPVRLVPAGEDR